MREIARLAAALALLLAACEEGLPFREPLHVRTASGVTVNLTGTSWRECTDDGAGGSASYREVHGEEGAITFLRETWTAPECTGTNSVVEAFAAYGEARGDVTVAWEGGTAPAPHLDPPPTATRVLLNSGGAYGGDAYLVDDTVTPRVLYTGNPASIGGDGYPTQLRVVQEVEQ